ncbi:site-specific DNA-methyltransferase [Microbispora rosea]|uniref:site-specific DNA-methyltransferase n=1 Tax=Microbispora rosea TaxID=58117 RepID=UPI00344814D3
MKKITVNDPEFSSMDLTAENLAQLKALLPEAFTEGKIDFEVLKQLLGGAVEEREEKYGLNWHGKRRARQLALTPSLGTLRPSPEESVDWDTTQNLVIEGDNLEVLKLLQKSYSGRVKLIYIDPPYNTGRDFVYPDDFRDNIRNYLGLTGQLDGNGHRVGSNTESSGRFHTDWLNMIYPRLKLARNLLRQDGVCFVSIDDQEVHNLRSLMDEIFGPENFICNLVWQKAYTANMTAQFVSDTHDHILLYARDSNSAKLGKFGRSEEQKAKFKNPDNDPRGPWKPENLSAGKFYSAGQFEIVGPTGETFLPPPGRYWRCNETQYKAWLDDNRITFGLSGTGRPMLKKYLSEMDDALTPSSWWNHEEFGSNKEASLGLKELFDGESCFQTPKPVRLIRKICELGSSGDDIVMDFFAGSGTTAHAVLERNAEMGENCRFILVQLPETLDIEDRDQSLAAEACDKFGLSRNLAELTKERIRRAGRKLRSANPLFSGDIGFRVFKLDSSNLNAWDPNPDNLEQMMLDHIEHLVSGRTEQDLLFEVLLKRGVDLCSPIYSREIAGKIVYTVGGVLFACFGQEITPAVAEVLALGIVEWRKELDPVTDSTVVFRDSAFVNDVAKVNITEILKQHGFVKVESL